MYKRLLLVVLIANMVFSFIPLVKYSNFHKNTNFVGYKFTQLSSLAQTTQSDTGNSINPTLHLNINKDVLPKERILLFFAAQEARKARKLYNVDMEQQVGGFLVDFFGPNTNEVIAHLRGIFQQIGDIDVTVDVARQNLIEATKYYCDLPPFQNIGNAGTRIEREQLWLLAAEAFATVIVTLKPTPLKQQLIKALLINFSLLPGSTDWLSADWILGTSDYHWGLFDRKNMIDALRLLKKWISSDFIKRRSRRLLEKLSDEAISSLFQTILAPLIWATPSITGSAAYEWMQKRLLRRSFNCKKLELLVDLFKKNFTTDELIGFLESAYSVLPEVSNPELLDKVNINSLRKLAVVATSRLRFKKGSNGFANSSYVNFKPRELAILGFGGGYMPLYPTRTCLMQMLLHSDNFNYGSREFQQKLISRYRMQSRLSKLSLDSLYDLVQKSLSSTDTDASIGDSNINSAFESMDDQISLIGNFFDRIKGLRVEGIVGPIQSMQQIELADQETLNRVEAKLIEVIEAEPRTQFIYSDCPMPKIDDFDHNNEVCDIDGETNVSSEENFSLDALSSTSCDSTTYLDAPVVNIVNQSNSSYPSQSHNPTKHLNNDLPVPSIPLDSGSQPVENYGYEKGTSGNHGVRDKFSLCALPECMESQGQLLELGKVSEWRKLLNDSLATVAKCIVGDEPTGIQKEAIPMILSGKNVFMCGGYGKTLAAALPLIQRLKADEQRDWTVRQRMRPRMLVLAPSRELCNETLSVYKSIGHIEKISTECLAGGRWFGKQRKDNNKLVDVVIGTPARVLRHSITKNNIRLYNVRYVVLDEVDELIAGGYSDELEALFKMIPSFQLISAAPWNAYQHPQFVQLADKFAKYFGNTTCVYDNSLHKGPSGSMHQFLMKGVRGGRDKIGMLIDELRWGRDRLQQNHKCIIFCNTISSCRAVLHSLVEVGFDAMGFYGEVPLLQRKHNYERFCNEGGLLVTTQARGLNFYGNNSNPISVINFDFPKSWIDYIIRANRCRGVDGGRMTSLIDYKSKYLALGISRSIKANLPLKGLSRHKSAYNPLTGRLRYLTQSGGYFKILNEIRRAEIEGDGSFDIYSIISRLHDKEANPRKRRSVRLSLEHEYRRRRRIFRVLLHKLKLIKRWNRAIRLKHKLQHKFLMPGWKRQRFPSMNKEAPIRKAMARIIQHPGTNYNYKTHERNLMLTKKLVKKHLKITRHLLSLLRSHKMGPTKDNTSVSDAKISGAVDRKLSLGGFKRTIGDRDMRAKRIRQCVLI